MRLIIALLFLSLGALSYGQNEAESTCNINNFRQYINKLGRTNCSLSGVDLSKLFLAEANFSGATFYFSNLRGAYLRGSNFTGADLLLANLKRANWLEESAKQREAITKQREQNSKSFIKKIK